MPRNPSEFVRLQEELEYWKQQLRNGVYKKVTREYILKNIRDVAKPLGIEVPDYNSTEFSEFLATNHGDV